MDLSAPPDLEAPYWWGEFDFSSSHAWRRWRIGPLTLWCQHLVGEWRLAWQTEGDDEYPDLPEANLPAPEGASDTATLERVASRLLGDRLLVTPRLADRPVVVRPETSFRLVPGGEIEFYVGTPLWVCLESCEPIHRLLDVPTRRPSDSWFGPSTTEGELCYSGKISARLQRDNLPISQHRAITQVRLHNQAEDDLLLERINLPVPNLALFVGEGGRLWTQTVSVERSSDAKRAEVRIEDAPPVEAGKVERVAEARSAMPRNVFSRALGALLG